MIGSMDLEFIIADPSGMEIGYLDNANIDVDIGSTDDFELLITLNDWDREKFGYGNRI